MHNALKFRVWDDEKGRFITGGNIFLGPDGSLYWQFGYQPLELLTREDREHLTVERWTGLVDSEGTEIYEGDIMTGARRPFMHGDRQAHYGVVAWKGAGATLVWYAAPSGDLASSILGSSIPLHNDALIKSPFLCRVIGNVHQHAQLLSRTDAAA